MRTVEAAHQESLLTALAAPGRSPDIPEAADAYGWLVGSWDLDVLHFWEDVSARGLKAELQVAWVLEGRGVQDVWIMPRRADRTLTPDPALNMYGTTLRLWDPTIQAWRISWSNPVANQKLEQIGRRIGKDVVQLGSAPDGTLLRWRFTEIRADAFRWIGEALKPDGATWMRQGEFLARRR